MREDKPKLPSQTKTNITKKTWFWPALYGGIAVLFVGMIWGYNALISPSETDSEWASTKDADGNSVVVQTNANAETLKYPFQEANGGEIEILQGFYDVDADEASREGALLVFDQTYVTSSGITLSMKGEPFEVLASMSGTVEKVTNDPFMGSEIVLSHANGMKTIYRSLTGIMVKEGDVVTQGDSLATTTSNEWNPTAGIHLHFEVLKDDVNMNPQLYLAF